MSDPVEAIPIEDDRSVDYVIAYDSSYSSDHDGTVINLFKSKLREKGLNYIEEDSAENENLKYILIIAENRAVLTKRAEEIRVSVPIKMVKVVDMMKVHSSHDEDHQDFCIKTNIDSNWKKKQKTSRWKSVLQFVRDWFRPQLLGGHIKFDFQQRYDERLFHHSQNDPFKSCSRIRSFLVHDLIKDIELTRKLKDVKSEEVSGDKQDHSHVYRGLEWLKKKGYVKKSFVPHSQRDRELFEEKRKEKHHRFPIQSVTAIREYLGEKVAFAFAWRAAWLSWGLTIPAIMGVLVVVVNLVLYYSKGRHKITVQLNDTETDSQLLDYGFFDNELLPFYAVLVLLLQINGFTIGWCRYKYIYAFKWGMLNYFLVKERQLVMNSTLKDLTKQRKLLSRILSIFTGILILIGMVLFNFIVFFVQQLFKAYLSRLAGLDKDASFYTSTIVVSLVNTVFVVLVINRWFANIAKKLCDKEYHTFPSDYERYLTWKVFFYSFTANNMRLLLMTLAPKIVLPFPIPRISLPGENYFEMEFCEEGKCLTTIGIQLGFFLVFKPLTSLLAYSKDDMWRGFKNKIRTLYVTLTCSSRSSSYSRTRRESVHPALIGRIDKEYRLYESDRFGERNQTLMDMNDKVAQYSFVILFGAVFPLSPLIAAVMEIITRTLDIKRYTAKQRRPVPRRYEGVGCWEEIIDLVNILAIITTVWIVVFRSTFVSQYDISPVLSISMVGSIAIIVYVIRAMSQVHSIPEKVKRFKHEEVGAVEVFLKSFFRDPHDQGPSSADRDATIQRTVTT